MSSERRSAASYPAIAFLDTSAVFALLDSTDSNHRQATALFRSINAARTRLVLTNFIRAEAHALILNRLGHAAADRFLADMATSPANTLIRVTEADEQQALELIARYKDKDFTITDATSFAVMERLGIDRAFSFDEDFRRYGWTVLPGR
jgi:predicted nucleic acid-binding protein